MGMLDKILQAYETILLKWKRYTQRMLVLTGIALSGFLGGVCWVLTNPEELAAATFLAITSCFIAGIALDRAFYGLSKQKDTAASIARIHKQLEDQDNGPFEGP